MEKESTPLQTVINIKEILMKIGSMVLEKWFTMIKVSIMVNGTKVKNKGKGFTSTLIKMFIQVTGVMEKNTEKVLTYLRQLK